MRYLLVLDAYIDKALKKRVNIAQGTSYFPLLLRKINIIVIKISAKLITIHIGKLPDILFFSNKRILYIFSRTDNH